QHSKNIYPTAPYAIKFYYPQNSTFQVSDAAVEYVDNPASGGIFLSKDGAPYVMEAEIKNTGNQPLPAFNVDMRILNSLNQVQVQDQLTTTALSPAQTIFLSSSNTFNPTAAGVFRFYTTTLLTGDATPSNNERVLEVRVVDTTQANILLTYTGNAPVPAGSGISWSGGTGGVGVEIVPPFYPAKITELQYFIVSNPNNVGFSATVFDDSGPSGTPGMLLDSISIPGGLVIPGIWNPVVLPTPIVINSGSFFVGWMMQGENIQIGQDNTFPISNRTYEVLGNVWAIYRSRDLTDLMVSAVIQKLGVGIEEYQTVSDIGNFYPVPASDKATLSFTLEQPAQNMDVRLYNIQGQLVSVQSYFAKNIGKHSITVDVASLSAGVYICEISSGKDKINKKLIVGR
ncbi:MAG: T9SS type A sorting domain-containing protein, partial [Bacteroidia bacterium]